MKIELSVNKMATKTDDKPPEDLNLTTTTLFSDIIEEDFMDELAWQFASLLCRQCWQAWWKHGHGPFTSLIVEPIDHLFDAL